MNIIGLDISKDTIDATLIKTNGQTDYTKISNNAQGFERLEMKNVLEKLLSAWKLQAFTTKQQPTI